MASTGYHQEKSSKCWQGCRGKSRSSPLVGVRIGAVWSFLKRPQIDLPYDSATPTPGQWLQSHHTTEGHAHPHVVPRDSLSLRHETSLKVHQQRIKKMPLAAVDSRAPVKNCDSTANWNWRLVITVFEEIRQTQTNFFFLLHADSSFKCVDVFLCICVWWKEEDGSGTRTTQKLRVRPTYLYANFPNH